MIDLRLGDCIEVLKTLEDNSVDSVVCDPPYHLTSTKGGNKGFMGKEWDGGDIAFRTDVWKECLRVLKPGGYLLAFSSSRTYHRMAVAIEDAGFDIRDQIMWIYGQGFPKSHNIGKAIDKIQGNKREVVGKVERKDFTNYDGSMMSVDNRGKHISIEIPITKGQSDYEGWGTALKPAHEPIVMARKPLSEKSVAENVLKWGTGGINIDGSRIEYADTDKNNINFDRPRVREKNPDWVYDLGITWEDPDVKEYNTEGRFPANIMFDDDGDEDWKRYFYCPKASKKERNAGLDNLPNIVGDITNIASKRLKCRTCGKWYITSDNCKCENPDWIEPTTKNHHPTIKPLALMEYLIKMTTRPGGVVLDCFMGSGSTGVAAKRNGFGFIGVEKEQEYFDIAQQRIDYET
jgi:site-specific DNA-methyltransferase (adenine-specific)